MKSEGIGRRAFFSHCLATLGGSVVGSTTGAAACTSSWGKPASDREPRIKEAIIKLESYGYRVKATIHNGPDSQMDNSYAYRDIGNPIASGIAGGNIALPIARRANRREEEITKRTRTKVY